MKVLRFDNGRECISDSFKEYCEDEGIVRHCMAKRTPQLNGVAETINRALLEKVRYMLSNANLGKY